MDVSEFVGFKQTQVSDSGALDSHRTSLAWKAFSGGKRNAEEIILILLRDRLCHVSAYLSLVHKWRC